jgi:hypothetical protein
MGKQNIVLVKLIVEGDISAWGFGTWNGTSSELGDLGTWRTLEWGLGFGTW